MKHRGGILFDAECLAHFDGEAAHESGISVMDECFREPHMFKHMLQVEFGDSFSHNCFITWYEDNHFSAVMVHDCEY